MATSAAAVAEAHGDVTKNVEGVVVEKSCQLRVRQTGYNCTMLLQRGLGLNGNTANAW